MTASGDRRSGETMEVAPPRRIATIGIYGFAVDAFVRRLQQADVRLLLDVRQRRGVRGPQYAWANAQRLQDVLERAGIAYRHHRELAPSTAMRQLQYAEDARRGVGKRSRLELAPEYTRHYTSDVLDRTDLAPLVSTLPSDGIAALLCVEREPEACHRSLIARCMSERHGVAVEHLLP